MPILPCPQGTYSVGRVLFDSKDMETDTQPAGYTISETHFATRNQRTICRRNYLCRRARLL